MKETWLVLKEQLKNLNVIQRLAKYDEKSTFQSHFLGMVWQILNPLINIIIYWVIFGIMLYGGRKMDGFDYVVWLLPGFIAWQFMRSEILSASNSMVRRVNMVSKMQFPVSTIPTMSLASQLINYWWLLGISILVLAIYGCYPTLYWLQFFYYFFCMIAFLYALGLLTSTVTTVVRDFHTLLNSIMQVMFWLSGTIFNFNANALIQSHPVIMAFIKLNPFYYVIDGMRDAFLNRAWFFNDVRSMIIFWSITLILLIVGSHMHLKFRSRFVDYI